MTKRLFLIITVVSLTAAGVIAGLVYMNLSTPVSKSEFRIYVTSDYNTDSVVSRILRNDPAARTRTLGLLLKHRDYDNNIHTGCYTVRAGVKPRDLAGILTGGIQTPVKLVVNSVRTVGQMARIISNQLMIDSVQVASYMNNDSLLAAHGYDMATVFCMIIPNTYEVYWNASVESVMTRLVKERNTFWNDQRKSKAAAMGLSELQVMTLASIIEEETSKADELPIVAGLYLNRLKRNMLLQADPTVIFALGGERPKRVLKAHLEVDSPYNTYKYAGLPPAPIRFVSTRSIDAVLNASRHNYLYMCAKEDFSGYHNFATTLSRHNANAARYQRALRDAGIR